MSRAEGFPPLEGRAPRVLVLGSLPSVRSLEAGQYYAHPRNAFWPIVDALFGIDAGLPYAERVAALKARGIAVWDVLGAATRPGSLDAAIDTASAEINDFPAFLARHPRLSLIAFNGRKAAELFRRRVEPEIAAPLPPRVTLPSTSPAHAALDFDGKLERWQVVREAIFR